MEVELSSDVGAASGRMEEIDSELSSILEQLGQAKVDKHETSRATRKAELLENLRRLFPGVVSSCAFQAACRRLSVLVLDHSPFYLVTIVIILAVSVG